MRPARSRDLGIWRGDVGNDQELVAGALQGLNEVIRRRDRRERADDDDLHVDGVARPRTRNWQTLKSGTSKVGSAATRRSAGLKRSRLTSMRSMARPAEA